MSATLRENSRGLTEHSVNARIVALAADGLKPRDISALLNVHPQIVLRVLGQSEAARVCTG